VKEIHARLRGYGEKTKGQKAEEIELHPDAWERLTEFVKQIAKAGPQHRQPKDKPKGAKHRAARKP